MTYYPPSHEQRAGVEPHLVSPVDPFVFTTLQSIVGKYVVVETVRGNIQGNLTSVLPDHIVITANHKSLYIRIAAIVWVMPEDE